MILTIEMDSLVLTEGDEAEIRLRIHGITSKINSYTFRLEYEMTSKFRKQRMRKKKNIVWNPQEGDSITLSEMITECDSYHIQICSISWEDLTGMYKVKKEFNKQISFLVMPKRYEMGFMQEKIARRDLMEQGFEYDGVRKYQEGDRISRVHWNLYAATGGLWVRKNEEEEEERVKIGLSLDDIEKDRISDYMAAFYSISFFLKSQGVIQEIYYGEHKYLLCHIEQYEELFTKTRQAQHLRETMCNNTVTMDTEQVSHTRNVSAMANTMAMILDIEEEISELRNILCKRQKEILTILDKMEPEYASVLSGRFIEGKSVKELRTVLFLSRRQIERRMNDALAEFQIKLNDLIEHGDLPWPA